MDVFHLMSTLLLYTNTKPTKSANVYHLLHRLGIRITRGQIKLFADPMQSDIIIASPVGLATKLAEDAAAAAEAAGGEGRGKKGGGGGPAAGNSSSRAADFLSSIEVCVIERADVMLMQNWQHVVTGGGW